MDTIHKIKYVLRRYFVSLYIYQLKDIPKPEQLNKLVEEALEGNDFHSPRSNYSNVFNQVNQKASNWTILLRLGSPKFRGARQYKLDEHSLEFNTKQPTKVKVVLSSNTVHPIVRNTINYGFKNGYLGGIALRNRLKCIQQSISSHPHVNGDGIPCLGGWNNAWSVAVANSNFKALRGVATSFLNTWTRNDAYWNINDYYHDWEEIPSEIRDTFTFNDYLKDVSTWIYLCNVYYNNSRRVNRVNIHRFLNFARRGSEWSRSTNIRNVIRKFNIYDSDKTNFGRNMYNTFMCHSLFHKLVADSSKRHLRWLDDCFSLTFGAIHDDVTTIVSNELKCPRSLSSRGAVEAMGEIPGAILHPSPYQLRSTSHYQIMRRLVTIVQDTKAQVMRNGRSIENTLVEDIFKHYNLISTNKYIDEKYTKEEEVYKVLSSTLQYQITNKEFNFALRGLLVFIDKTDIDNKFKQSLEEIFEMPEIEKADKFAKWFMEFSLEYKNYKNRYDHDWITENNRLNTHFVSKSLRYIQKAINKWQITRIQDAISKYKPIQNTSSATNAGESQLSLESF